MKHMRPIVIDRQRSTMDGVRYVNGYNVTYTFSLHFASGLSSTRDVRELKAAATCYTWS